MKFETVKSFILMILVAISLMLTFGLWSYQPNYDTLYSEQNTSELDTDIGGEQVTKQDIIQPESMVFHRLDEHFGFRDPLDFLKIYQNMQSWQLYDLEVEQGNQEPTDDYRVEITFPTAMPMELLPNIFELNGDNNMPSWSFQRIFITFDQDAEILNVQFLSTDGRYQGHATIHDKNSYDQLWRYMNSQRDMDALMAFDVPESNGPPIYLPNESVEMTQYSLSVDNTNLNTLVNALFSKPSLVSTNVGEAYFTDSQRGMQLLNDRKTVEFFNPYQGSYERMSAMDLLDNSMQHINSHMGWTEDYYLQDITTATNKVTYRMRYKGYPVYNYRNIATIEQQWRNQDIFNYIRPLFQTENNIGEDTVNLPSGNEVNNVLQGDSAYNVTKIRDIQIGYTLSYEDRASESLTLIPSWYVNYDGNWREINFDFDEPIKGGS